MDSKQKILVQYVRKDADRLALARKAFKALVTGNKSIKNPMSIIELQEAQSLLFGNRHHDKIGVIVARKTEEGKVIVAASKWKKTADSYNPGRGKFIAVDRLDKTRHSPLAQTLYPYIEQFKDRAARYFRVDKSQIVVLGDKVKWLKQDTVLVEKFSTTQINPFNIP